jgi:Protein of unknown function (DUF3626)
VRIVEYLWHNAPVSTHDSDPVRRALTHVAALSREGPISDGVRVTLNFHPETVVAALAREGRYRSQFETGTSNGGLTAHPGGDRWRWESRLFGGAYDDTPPGYRPVYGSLNLQRRDVGASPRFGSAHLRLTEGALRRSTFCFPDSVFEPVAFGVAGRMGLVTEALRSTDDALDDYVEAQVHGPVRVDTDVEALVLDPCYRDTEVVRAAARLPCPLQWHRGFRLGVDELRKHPAYRGPEYVALGLSLARDGYLDGRIIGEARATGAYDPQALKRVWHYIARYG